MTGNEKYSPMEDDEVDVGRLFHIIWGGRWVVVIGVFISCLLGLLYLVASKPVYEANGTVQVEQDGKNATSSLGELASLFGAPMETEAEIQILKSRMVLLKVIENLGLEVSAEPVHFPLFGAFVARWRGKSEALEAPLLGLSGYAWGGEKIKVSRFEVPERSFGLTYDLTAHTDGYFSLFDSEGVEVLQGRVGELVKAETVTGEIVVFVQDLRANAGTRFKLRRIALAEVLDGLSKSVTIAEAGKKSGVISISVAGPNGPYVANVIRQIQDAYVRQNVERRSAEAEQSLNFLQQQLPQIKARTDEAQVKLNAYQMRQGSINVTKETELVLQQSVDLETKKLELIGQRQQAIQRFTSQHPIVVALDAQINGLEREQNNIKKRTETLPETQQEVLSLMRDLEVNTQIYTTLLNSAQELQVAKAGTIGNVRIIDYPLVPDRKTKPRATLVAAMSVILGLLSGVGYLFLQRTLFRGVERPDEVERLLGLATYAAVPYTPTQKSLAQALVRRRPGAHILAIVEGDNIAVESLRGLRTSLQFALLEAPNKVVMFTGPTPGIGKSFVSVNLAAVLAMNGKKVVVVDCDLRRGHLHKYIGEAASPGLSDYIAGRAELSSICRKTAVPGLTMITNGTVAPNPAELLLHDKFAALLNQLSMENDHVIVDTPPVLPVADAGVIGRLCGCVLIVLKEGAHPIRMVEETVRRLRQAGVIVRGTVFNQVGQRAGGYGYYYSSYGYSYRQKYKSDVR